MYAIPGIRVVSSLYQTDGSTPHGDKCKLDVRFGFAVLAAGNGQAAQDLLYIKGGREESGR